MIKSVTIALSLLVLASCVSAPVKDSSIIEIKPEGKHEECSTVKSSQKLLYSFYASDSVTFNIHDTAGVKVFDRGAVNFDDGTFQPASEDVYCLTWVNPQKMSVSVDFRYEIWPVIRKPLSRPPIGMEP